MAIVDRVRDRARGTGFVPVPNYRETPPWPLIGMSEAAAKVSVGRVYYADSSLWVGGISSSIHGRGIDKHLTRVKR